jgi:hypothetical protein
MEKIKSEKLNYNTFILNQIKLKKFISSSKLFNKVLTLFIKNKNQTKDYIIYFIEK